VADFIKLYIVLIFIPVAAILVPAWITWARDLDRTASRMRRVEELSKRVSFWEDWVKAVVAVTPPDEARNERTEFFIRALLISARHELADAGREALSIYKLDEYMELREFKLGFAEFQRFRAGLPWYRRAFLLYSAPNFAVRIPKFGFHLMLTMAVFALVTAPFPGGVSVRHYLSKLWMLKGVDAFANAHRVAFDVIAFVYSICAPLWMRQVAIWRENDRSLYVRDRVRDRFGDSDVGRDSEDAAHAPPAVREGGVEIDG